MCVAIGIHCCKCRFEVGFNAASYFIIIASSMYWRYYHYYSLPLLSFSFPMKINREKQALKGEIVWHAAPLLPGNRLVSTHLSRCDRTPAGIAGEEIRDAESFPFLTLSAETYLNQSISISQLSLL